MSGYQGEVLTMTLQDAVRVTGLSYSVIYEGVKSGSLKSIRPRRSYLVTPADLMAWMHAESEAREDT